MKKEVKCLTCSKTVTVELLPYGAGCIAKCPECKHLAYVGSLPKGGKNGSRNRSDK